MTCTQDEKKAASAEAPAERPAGREEVAQLGETLERGEQAAGSLLDPRIVATQRASLPEVCRAVAPLVDFVEPATGVTITLAQLRRALLDE